MINMAYSTWRETCESIFNLDEEILNKYLQLYPFSYLDNSEKDYIKNEDFFNLFIKKGFIFSLDSTYKVAERFIQKGNGSFRKTYLVSPVMYLYLLAIGKQISCSYKDSRSWNTNCYYAADFTEMAVFYKKSYDDFVTNIHAAHSMHKYYMKIDFSNYYNSLDVNHVFEKIDIQENIIDARTKLVYTTLIKIVGNGRYPTVDNNGGLSYIATVVNLSEFDKAIENFFEQNSNTSEYHLVRYLDDLYMFFSCEDELFSKTKNELNKFLANLTALNGLQLNEKKQVIRESSEINEDVKNGFYDFFVNGESINFNEYYSSDELLCFLSELAKFDSDSSMEDYLVLVKKSFEKEGIECSARAIINSYVYYHPQYFDDSRIKEYLNGIVLNNYQILKYDVKPLLRMVLNTKNSRIIKNLLNQIFISYREGNYDYYDELILTEYLLSRSFKHADLGNILITVNPNVANFIKKYCMSSFVDTIQTETKSKIYIDNCGLKYMQLLEDTKLNFMYLMHKHHSIQNSMLESFAYYKNYFDRFIAHTMNCLGEESTKKRKPNFKMFYKEQTILLYLNKVGIEKFDKEVSKAFELRNKNPVSHGSAEILEDIGIRTSDYENVTDKLREVISTCRKMMSEK